MPLSMATQISVAERLLMEMILCTAHKISSVYTSCTIFFFFGRVRHIYTSDGWNLEFVYRRISLLLKLKIVHPFWKRWWLRAMWPSERVYTEERKKMLLIEIDFFFLASITSIIFYRAVACWCDFTCVYTGSNLYSLCKSHYRLA